MVIRADHVAGAAFVGLGLLVFALSGDLPTGQLSMPGSGFMPKLVAGLIIILGAALVLRARESEPLAALGWNDAGHASLVMAITACAIALYTVLGFVVTMALMMTAMLTVIERRNAVRAVAYGLGVTLVTFIAFHFLLQTPLPEGPLGF